MNDIKLIVSNEELEVEGSFGFGLNYNIDDVKDPSKRSGNYSKTIKLAGTKKANKLLGGIFDINSDFTYFNPNIKSQAKIIVNSITVIDGFMQLISIDKDFHSSTSGNNVVYNIGIQSNTVDFYTDIKDKKLNELDFSDFNHIYTKSNIESSWSHTNKEVYTYPLMKKGSNTYETKDFKPAIFHKSYVKRMAMENGYDVGGTLFDESTPEGDAYAHEIIPYNGDLPELSEAEQERRLFKAGLTIPNTVLQSTTTVTGDPVFSGINTNLLFLDNDTTSGNFDPNGHYDTVTNKFTADVNGNFNFRLESSFTMKWDSNGVDKSWVTGISDSIFKVYAYVNGVQTVVQYNFKRFAPPQIPLTSANSWVFEDAQNFTFYITNLDLLDGDELTFKYELIEGNQQGFVPASFNGVDVDFIVNTGSLKNEVNTLALHDGDEISISNHIPKEIKQIDLIVDLIKRYNAYIYPDPNNSRKIIFDTRDSYLDAGGTLDWSDKKDYSKKDVIKLLSELQSKELEFTYSSDSDDYNKLYSDSVDNEIFGVKKVEFENDFVKGSKKIQTPFSPTPLVGNSNNPIAIVPGIEYTNPKTKIRVLYYGGLKGCLNGSEWTFNYIVAGVANSSTFTTYPYAGHYDDPINPTLDLNFGTNNFSFYNNLETTTENTLYNRFWKNYVDQIDTGKLLTTYFNLNEVDISFIKDAFNTKIFVKDSYYYLNKIIDYNPVDKGVTKVELLKIKDGIVFVDKTVTTNTEENAYANFAKNTGDQNGNYSESDGVIFNGKNNYVGSGSDNAIITGDNNFIADNVPNAFIIGGSGKRISEPGEGWVGETQFFNGTPAELPSHKTLSMNITQDELLVPVHTELSDSFLKYYFFQYISIGFYKFICPGGFDMSTTSVLASLNSENNNNSVITYIDSPEQIFIKTFDDSGALANGILDNAFFEFRFYE